MIKYSNPDYLFSKIGKENFENLNDAIDKLAHLLALQGLTYITISALANTNDTELVEIKKEVKRVEQIYIDMDNYKNNSKDTNAKVTNLDLSQLFSDIEL